MNSSIDTTNSGRALVENIKERVSLVDIVSRYVALTPGGKNLKGPCPLHGEKTPSFYVSATEGYWKCFGCGKGGDVITFIQEIEHVSFKEAISYLAEVAGIELRYSLSGNNGANSEDSAIYAVLGNAKDIYRTELKNNTEALAYLRSRGVNDEMIEKFQIGFAPDNWQAVYSQIRKNYSDKTIVDSGLGIQGKKGVYDRFRSRIMFPTHDIRDRVITFSGRLWSSSGEYQTERVDAGKYVNGPETIVYHKSRTLFGLNLARQAAYQKKQLIIVEGHLDCVMSHQVGFTETVAIGGTALTEDHILMIKRYCDKVVLAFDGDTAGQKALLRSLPILFKHNCTVTVARFPNGADPADVAQSNPAGYRQAIEGGQDYITHRLRMLREEGVSLTDIDRVLKQEIYPLLATISNPLLVDSAVMTIARSIGVSNDSIIREHIQKTKPVPIDDGREPISIGAHVAPTGALRDWALRLVTVWNEMNQRYVSVDTKIVDYLLGSTGITISGMQEFSTLYNIESGEYTLRFEWLYGAQDPKDVLPAIVEQFAHLYIRDAGQRYLTSLHQAVDDVEREKLEQAIVELSNYKRYSETHRYEN